MSAPAPLDRIELSPAVRAVLEGDGPQSRLMELQLRYLQELIAPDTPSLDSVVTADVHCHELDAIGIPQGLEGLRMFRRQINGAIPDERIYITAVRFDGDNIIEADMVMNATQTGEMFGIPATGRTIRFDVSERCRFVDGKLAERWAQVDLEDIKRQITSPVQ